jgi:hypothetical protein
VLLVLFTVRRDPEPAGELLAAEQYLNLAREQRADLDAPATFGEAATRLREARQSMQRQFARPAFLRSYEETREILVEARALVTAALAEARDTLADRRHQLREEIRRLRREAAGIRVVLQNLPSEHPDALHHVVVAESRIRAAEMRLTAEESIGALDSMGLARSELNLALQDIRGLLLDFLSRRDEWLQDLNKTLDWTRSRNRPAVVVDKLNHRLHLVRDGRSVRAYPAELGPHWMDRKVREGDQATPEGSYQVIRKKSAGQTRYHKALLLDYPNREDSARFHRLVEEGALPRYSRIGGLIEIHGEGGKGEDWTLGCVSLRNEDIDELYGQLPVGTMVTIIGLWDAPAWLARAMGAAEQ